MFLQKQANNKKPRKDRDFLVSIRKSVCTDFLNKNIKKKQKFS